MEQTLSIGLGGELIKVNPCSEIHAEYRMWVDQYNQGNAWRDICFQNRTSSHYFIDAIYIGIPQGVI